MKVTHSGFANERVLNGGLSDAGLPGVTGSDGALGGFCGCWFLGFSAVHGPLWVVVILEKGVAATDEVTAGVTRFTRLRLMPTGRRL